MLGGAPDSFWWIWMTQELNEHVITFAATTSIQQALPENPMRHCLILGSNSGNQTFWRIGGGNTVANWLSITTVGPAYIVNRWDIGDAICRPVSVSTSAAVSVTVGEWSYAPDRWAKYQEVMARAISN